ncbi:zinc finger protein 282-like isoform X4 [Pleurodeles waltl]|uniref:zinc finger protein 282-like isoform X4 n=1 Tax=Pleurodeles waltl TaxID=8319 RepID=UPI003709AA2B
MPRPEPAPVSFDVSTCFSKEEWKLLHEWQRDLYRSVMKEIHQALMSLGPLITHTVFSLKASEKEELCFSDNQESSQSDATASPKESFGLARDENLNIPQSLDGRGRNGHVTTEEKPISGFLDHPSEEVAESSTDPNSGHEIISFAIKDEEEMELIDRPDCRRTESAEMPTEFPAISSVFSQTIKPEEEVCLQEQRVPGRRTSALKTSVRTKRIGYG